MIKNVAELLAAILRSEVPTLDASPISHGPTIGQMYEGLSGRILERAIPQDLGLRVVTGFVTDGENLSGQIDRMITSSDGKAIPHTDAVVCHARDVIAVIEVKKTLTRATLTDAITQLAKVRDLESAWIRLNGRTNAEEVTREPKLARLAFEQMTGRVAPLPPDLESLSANDRLIYSTLYREQFTMLRIVFGIHGYRTEAGLRRAFLRVMQERLGSPRGLTPSGMPHLIVGGDFSIYKANGQPYTAPLIDGEWPYALSTRANPVLLLLELLWTRLDHLFGLGNPWGDDLEVEAAHRLVGAVGTENGWVCSFVDAEEVRLRQLPATENWAPARLTEPEFAVLTALVAGERISLSDTQLEQWLKAHQTTAPQLRNGLLATRLVALDGDELVLTTTNCTTAILPSGEYVAADDITGRLTRWLARQSPRS